MDSFCGKSRSVWKQKSCHMAEHTEYPPEKPGSFCKQKEPVEDFRAESWSCKTERRILEKGE